MSRALDVYLHGVYAGQLVQNDVGKLLFTYDASYVAEEQLALSLSLPLCLETYEGDIAKAFFSGLLPEDIVCHRLARYLGVSEKNPFALLEAIGGECAGALSFYPEGIAPPKPEKADIEVLDDQKLQHILELLKRRPLLAGEGGLRLSLAGAQDKIAVGVSNKKIALIKGSTPTTHILKPMIADIKDSVQNELFCMRLAKLVGIKVPKTEIHYLNKVPYFLVERYDRQEYENTKTQRLHQEDFCQAMGIMPEIKYEREGGPSIMQCQHILRNYSSKPAVDQINFLQRIIFNYLIGNADAHGKNFSLLYRNKIPELSPAYDLLSTEVYPELSKKMAMKIGGKYKAEEIFMRHWQRLVPDTVVAKKNLEKQIKNMAAACLQKADELKRMLKKEGVQSSIFDDIFSVIRQRVEHLDG